MKILEQNEYSKNQIRRGEGRICKNCLASETNDSQNVSKFMLFKPLYGIEGDKADKIRGIRAIVVKSELLIVHFLHLQNQLNCRQ